jgi:hypothetical protein
MSCFRRVDGAGAGPTALGILIAPGDRTLVILRPRALEYDLLPVRASLRDGLGSGFWEMDRAEAVTAANSLGHALEKWAAGGAGSLGPIPANTGDGYWVQAEVGEHTLLVCGRAAGRAYQAQVFTTLEDARAAAAALRRVLCPAAAQELYFNTRNFTR